jgi:integrase
VEAYKTWADRLQLHKHANTIGDLLERYQQQVVPTKAPKTQKANNESIKRLRKVFAHMPIYALKPVHVYQYLDLRREHRTSVNRDVEVLSHAYTKAIEWGLVENHPIKGKVISHGERPRERYVEDRELIEALKVANKVVRAYVGVKVLTGLRRADILSLRIVDLKEDGIHVQPRKTAKTTGKRLVISWTEALHQAVEEAKTIRPQDIAPWLFCTRKGEPYIKADGSANAFDSLWQRFMGKALKDTELRERFQERDLRAKTASDMPLELAAALLGHADPRITKRVYRRRPDVVKPLK